MVRRPACLEHAEHDCADEGKHDIGDEDAQSAHERHGMIPWVSSLPALDLNHIRPAASEKVSGAVYRAPFATTTDATWLKRCENNALISP
jgi:hypothetical protein